MVTVYQERKIWAGVRFAAGIGLIIAAATLPAGIAIFTPFMVAVGLFLAISGSGAALRAHAAQEREAFLRQQTADVRFARSAMPRQLFTLLFAVAAADGAVGEREREVVRQFLLERFLDPDIDRDLHTWEAQAAPPSQIEGLARAVAAVLGDADREILFAWCCMVAFADRKFSSAEHTTLQAAARGLGLPQQHARWLFLRVKRSVLQDAESSRIRTRDARAEALGVLGLDREAAEADVRARHRELVKRFHPDLQSHLGPRAQEEAAARFREIQKAYEALTGKT